MPLKPANGHNDVILQAVSLHAMPVHVSRASTSGADSMVVDDVGKNCVASQPVPMAIASSETQPYSKITDTAEIFRSSIDRRRNSKTADKHSDASQPTIFSTSKAKATNMARPQLMRRHASAKTPHLHLRYIDGYDSSSGIPSNLWSSFGDLRERPSRDTVLSNDDIVCVRPSTLPGDIWNVGDTTFEPVRPSSRRGCGPMPEANNCIIQTTGNTQPSSYKDTCDLSPTLVEDGFDVHTGLVSGGEGTIEGWAKLVKMRPVRPQLMRSAFSNWTYASEESSSPSASPNPSDMQSPTFSSVQDSFSGINSPCLSDQANNDISCELTGSQAIQSPSMHPTEALLVAHQQPTSGEIILPLPTVGSPTESDMKRQAAYFELPVGFYGGTSPGNRTLWENTIAELKESVSLLMKSVSPHLFEGTCPASSGLLSGSDDLVYEFGYLGEAVL